MSRRRSALLAAWGTAWLQGAASHDDVVDAVRGSAPQAHPGSAVDRSLAGTGFDPRDAFPVSTALTDWRRAGASSLRLVLPIPGDVRGLGGPAEFRSIALTAGEAVFGAGWGLTCEVGEQTASSAGRQVTWRRSPVEELAPDPLGISEADYELTEAIRETASTLAARGAPSWLRDVAGALSGARRAGERLWLPASHPPRAVRVLAQAERLAAVLELVDRDDTGEVTVHGMAERRASLQPLRLAVRRALMAGYNAGAEVTAGP